jgi:Tol biopolymer transport system component
MSGEEILMKRATALTLLIAAACSCGVAVAASAELAEAVEVGGGPRQRWDCVAFSYIGDIYVVDLDGTGLTRLTADDAYDCLPAFSPDGTKIAFTSERGDDCAVYVINVDGTDKRRLSPPYYVPEPEIDTSEDIAALYAAGSDVGSVFSPDGKIIVATRVFPGMGDAYSGIIFLPTSGGPEENFYTKIIDAWERKKHTFATETPPCGDISDLTFSGDGRRVAFRDYPGSSGKRLWVANADGSGARLLAEGPVYSYALSPDGKKLAFCEFPDAGWRFCVINADGTGERLLTNGDRHSERPAFSADGKKIIYESSVPRGLFEVLDIYIINADGSEPRALTRTPVNERRACFTPYGSKIVFVMWAPSVDDYAEPGIYVMNADGSGRRFLVAGHGFSVGPSLVEGRLLDSYGNWHDVVDDPEATPPGE